MISLCPPGRPATLHPNHTLSARNTEHTGVPHSSTKPCTAGISATVPLDIRLKTGRNTTAHMGRMRHAHLWCGLSGMHCAQLAEETSQHLLPLHNGRSRVAVLGGMHMVGARVHLFIEHALHIKVAATQLRAAMTLQPFLRHASHVSQCFAQPSGGKPGALLRKSPLCRAWWMNVALQCAPCSAH